MDRKRFARAMAVAADYYGHSLSEGQLEVYWRALQGWTDEQLSDALQRWITAPDTASRWMPKVSDLRRMLEGSSADQAEEAWARVEAAARSRGRYASVDFGPVANAAIRIAGGWSSLCQTHVERLHYFERAFKSAHAALAEGRQPLTPALTDHHRGLEERDCARLERPYDASQIYRSLPPGAAPQVGGHRPDTGRIDAAVQAALRKG